MDVLIVADGHYYIDKNENVYAESVFDYRFYSRYLSCFDKVYAIVRAQQIDELPKGCMLASGENVSFLLLPDTHGVKEYFINRRKTKKLVETYIKEFECAIFRVPGVVSNLVAGIYQKSGKKFAIEVVVDPWEYFAKGTVKGVSRPIVRYLWTHRLKYFCQKAVAVSYVTEKYLQEKYPCKAMENKKGYITASYSSVELPDDSFGKEKTYKKSDKHILSHVANSFSGYGKGHLEAMQVVKRLNELGYDTEINFVGDGKLLGEFRKYAGKLGIADKVNFMGRLPSGESVRKVMRDSDIFLFPTKAEGLPRVVLEAMAEGVPIISSPVCGIPEIIDQDLLFVPKDIEGMAKKIAYLFNRFDILMKISQRNIVRAQQYKSSLLQKKRDTFYKEYREICSNIDMISN